MTNKKKKCVFAGTFDPPTLGHKAMVEDCLQLFDEVVLAVMTNPAKAPCFTAEERMEMLRLDFGNEPRVRILCFQGTVAELLAQENTKIYVRGIRNGTDLDYENANFYASKKLDKDLIAVYLPCRQELLHVSSSMVRNSLQFGTPYSEYVSEAVYQFLENRKK